MVVGSLAASLNNCPDIITTKIDSDLFINPNWDLYVNTIGKKKPELDGYGYP